MSHNYTEEIVTKKNVHTFYIGFDIDDSGKYSQNKSKFYDELFEDLVSFAFGPKADYKMSSNDLIRKLREASKMIYSIKKNKTYNSYKNRGEFGELILFHLLNEYFKAPSLISKIYFKDTPNVAAHGFDAVHINPKTKTMWLGESKLYKDYNGAFSELKKDLDNHFNTKFFDSEFQVISHRVFDDEAISDQPDFVKDILNNKTKNLKKLENINVALFASFDSEIFKNVDKEKFEDDLNKSINLWKEKAFEKFNETKWNDKLEIYLLMFPVESKDELINQLHNKLEGVQKL